MSDADGADSADPVIEALRTGHDRLAALVETMSDTDLERRSGAQEWTVADVLSHMGNSAEVSRAVIQAALDGEPPPGREFAPPIWQRWEAMAPRDQAEAFVHSQDALISMYESMDIDARANLRIDLGYLPEPVDVATAARMRLSEVTLHGWDVRVAFDDAVDLVPEAVPLLLHAKPDLTAWISRPDELGGTRAVIAVTTSEPVSRFALRLDTPVGIDFDVPDQVDGTLTLPASAWLRLVAGRLAPERTPSGVQTSGAADLDLLRQVFPGY